MSGHNDLYNHQELAQFAGRTHANLYMGPVVGPGGHDPSVLKFSVQEIPFEDSIQSERYLRSVVKKDPNARVIKNKARMRFVSRGDE
jgi:hypothetical protein